MPPLADHLTLILHAVLNALRSLALRTAPAPYVLSLGHTTYIVPPAHRPEDNPHLPEIPRETRALLRDRAARAIARLLALFARWQAGTLPRPRFDFPRPKPTRPRPARPPAPRLPRSRGWAGLRMLELRQHAEGLAHVLARPDLAPFLDACPQAGRLLRPLCHAIGAQLPPRLALPRRAPSARRPRPAKPRPPRLTDPDLNLPVRVIRAVSHWRKKFGPG
jgi:hypothetical protein